MKRLTNWRKARQDGKRQWRGNIRQNDTFAVYVDYDEYMHSREWYERRAKRIKMDGNRCAYCGGTEGLQVHHITYERLGRERMEDLVTLCRYCHRRVHDADD